MMEIASQARKISAEHREGMKSMNLPRMARLDILMDLIKEDNKKAGRDFFKSVEERLSKMLDLPATSLGKSFRYRGHEFPDSAGDVDPDGFVFDHETLWMADSSQVIRRMVLYFVRLAEMICERLKAVAKEFAQTMDRLSRHLKGNLAREPRGLGKLCTGGSIDRYTVKWPIL